MPTGFSRPTQTTAAWNSRSCRRIKTSGPCASQTITVRSASEDDVIVWFFIGTHGEYGRRWHACDPRAPASACGESVNQNSIGLIPAVSIHRRASGCAAFA